MTSEDFTQHYILSILANMPNRSGRLADINYAALVAESRMVYDSISKASKSVKNQI